ncbi:MAG: EAL domain-containing protein [Lachnospiraceae bacterium]
MNKKSFKIWFTLVVVIFISAISALSLHATESPTVIKVGYMLNYGTVKSPMVKGSEGYGYEYLNRIFYRAGIDYELEFVYCEWSDVKQMLLDGEIDIMGPATYSEANEDVYIYSDLAFGENNIFLSTLSEYDISYHDYNNINGSTIAVQEDNPNEYLLTQFLEENNIDATIVYFSDNNYVSVLKENEYDYCLSSSLQTFTELSPVAVLGSLDFYYVTSTDNTELMDILNEGMSVIDKTEYMYQEKLYLEYYDYSILSSTYISQEDYELLQEQEMYFVGIENIYSPIAYIDSNGQFQGIALDAMEMLSGILGIPYEWVEITDDTTDEEFAALDFSFISLDSDLDSIESDIYYEIPAMLIDRNVDDGVEISTIGVLNYYGITEIEIANYLYGREIYEYTNATELLDAYNSGIIDSMILSTVTLNMLRDDFDEIDYVSNTLDFNVNLSISFSDTYSKDKIEIVNKAISKLENTELAASALAHSTDQESELTIYTIIEAYSLYIVIFIALIILLFAISQFNSKRALGKLLNEDKLTGLLSRYKFLSRTKARLAQKTWKVRRYSIITIDIDNFKYINEVYGYDVGSRVLQRVAENLKINTAKRTLISRFNDDNFILLVRSDLLDKKLEDALKSGNGLYKELAGLIGQNYHITFSIGVYHINKKNQDLSFMIDCANLARGKGKGTAGTTINVFSSQMDADRITKNDIITNMEKAVEENEFILYYQPKIDLTSGELVGAESLVRWMKNGTLMPPNLFIPIFERNGFMETLDYYILDKACLFVKENPNTPKISVNLSGITMVSEHVVERVLHIIKSYDIPFEKIDIEVTETAFVDRYKFVLKVLDTFKVHGLTISMDDFGAGISSLNRLKNLPIDTLKIDREFIVDSLENEKGAHIIKHVIDMAKDLGLETVAEGIETKEQEEFLNKLGCDIGQGYFFARPLPEKDFIQYLSRQKHNV